MALTEDKLKVYEILSKLVMQWVITLFAIGVFVWIMTWLRDAQTKFDMGKFYACEGLVTAIIIGIYKYWMPGIQIIPKVSARKSTKKQLKDKLSS